MRGIIQFLREETRPIRKFFTKLFMSKNERKALSNFHDVSELKNREISYSVKKEEVIQKKNHVIYTCITGGYDNLIQQTFYNSKYNYICYTDNEDWIKQKVIGIWQIRPLVMSDYSNTLNNRWHKTHPHYLFPDFEDSIYIDGNIDILNEGLFNRIKEKTPADLVIPKHFSRNCIYKEIGAVKKSRKVSRDNLKEVKQFLLNENFPKGYGLTENNVIYRKHSSTQVKKIMEDWWSLILYLVPRDQLTFAYVLWKHNINPDDIEIDNIRLFSNETALYFGKHL